MPLFDYKCKLCNSKTEYLLKNSDEIPYICENCGAVLSLVKEISRSTFALKGSGWYKDLYGNKSETSSSN
jgi:putative FmdB family regulatory protein